MKTRFGFISVAIAVCVGCAVQPVEQPKEDHPPRFDQSSVVAAPAELLSWLRRTPLGEPRARRLDALLQDLDSWPDAKAKSVARLIMLDELGWNSAALSRHHPRHEAVRLAVKMARGEAGLAPFDDWMKTVSELHQVEGPGACSLQSESEPMQFDPLLRRARSLCRQVVGDEQSLACVRLDHDVLTLDEDAGRITEFANAVAVSSRTAYWAEGLVGSFVDEALRASDPARASALLAEVRRGGTADPWQWKARQLLSKNFPEDGNPLNAPDVLALVQEIRALSRRNSDAVSALALVESVSDVDLSIQHGLFDAVSSADRHSEVVSAAENGPAVSNQHLMRLADQAEADSSMTGSEKGTLLARIANLMRSQGAIPGARAVIERARNAYEVDDYGADLILGRELAEVAAQAGDVAAAFRYLERALAYFDETYDGAAEQYRLLRLRARVRAAAGDKVGAAADLACHESIAADPFEQGFAEVKDEDPIDLAEVYLAIGDSESARVHTQRAKLKIDTAAGSPSARSVRRLAILEQELGDASGAKVHQGLANSLESSSSPTLAYSESPAPRLTMIEGLQNKAQIEVDSRRGYAVSAQEGKVVVINVHTGRQVRAFRTEPSDSEMTLSLNRTDGIIAYGGSAGILRIARVDDGSVMARFAVPPPGSLAGEWSSDQPFNAGGDAKQLVRAGGMEIVVKRSIRIARIQWLADGDLLVGGLYRSNSPFLVRLTPDSNGIWKLGDTHSELVDAMAPMGPWVASEDGRQLYFAYDEISANTPRGFMPLSSSKGVKRIGMWDAHSRRLMHSHTADAELSERDQLLLDKAHDRLWIMSNLKLCAVRLPSLGSLFPACVESIATVHDILVGHLRDPAWMAGERAHLLGRSNDAPSVLWARIHALQSCDSLAARAVGVATDCGIIGKNLELTKAVFLGERDDELLVWSKSEIYVSRSGVSAALTRRPTAVASSLGADKDGLGLLIIGHGPRYDELRQVTFTEQGSRTQRVAGLADGSFIGGLTANSALIRSADALFAVNSSSATRVSLPASGKADLVASDVGSLLLKDRTEGTVTWLSIADDTRTLRVFEVGKNSRLGGAICGDRVAVVTDNEVTADFVGAIGNPRPFNVSGILDGLKELGIQTEIASFGELIDFSPDCQTLVVRFEWASAADQLPFLDQPTTNREGLAYFTLAKRGLELVRVSPVLNWLGLNGLVAVDSSRVVLSKSGGLRLFDGASSRLLAVRENLDVPAGGLKKVGSRSKVWAKDNAQSHVGGKTSGRWVLLDVDALDELGELHVLPEGCWIFSHPTGLFESNCSAELSAVSWVLPEEPFHPYPVDAFAREYFEPGLVYKLIHDLPIRSVPALVDVDRRATAVSIDGIEIDANRALATLTVSAPLAAASERGELEVIRDGLQVRLEPLTGIEWRAQGSRLIASLRPISLASRANQVFQAATYNDAGVRSEPFQYELKSSGEVSSGKTVVVAIGVQHFTDPRWDLSYARNDAKAILAAMEKYAGATKVQLVNLTGEGANSITPSKENIRQVIAHLATGTSSLGQMQEVERVGPDDTVLITYSGHGITSAPGEFLLFPTDVGQRLEPPLEIAEAQHLISAAELAEWTANVDSENMVVIIDACQAAASITGDASFKPVPVRTRGLGYMAYMKGMRVLVATGAGAPAIESAKLAHGLLTYALVPEGLSSRKADTLPPDFRVSIAEWVEFAKARVPELTQELQRGEILGSRGLAVVAREAESSPAESGAMVEHLPVQIPQLFDFRRDGARELILDLDQP
jgi:tetratricopeptide (TPR) repeat protein